jgi:hypothetical protein
MDLFLTILALAALIYVCVRLDYYIAKLGKL